MKKYDVLILIALLLCAVTSFATTNPYPKNIHVLHLDLKLPAYTWETDLNVDGLQNDTEVNITGVVGGCHCSADTAFVSSVTSRHISNWTKKFLDPTTPFVGITKLQINAGDAKVYTSLTFTDKNGVTNVVDIPSLVSTEPSLVTETSGFIPRHDLADIENTDTKSTVLWLIPENTSNVAEIVNIDVYDSDNHLLKTESITVSGPTPYSLLTKVLYGRLVVTHTTQVVGAGELTPKPSNLFVVGFTGYGVGTPRVIDGKYNLTTYVSSQRLTR